MNNSIEILGIKVDNERAQESVVKVAGFFESEPLSTVSILSAGALVEAEHEPKWAAALEKLDLTVIGDKEILKAAGIEDRERLEEIEEQYFLKGILQYAADKEKNILLLTEKDSEKELLAKSLKKMVKGLCISKSFSLEDQTEDEESIVNFVNAESPDMVIAAIPNPDQEIFLFKVKAKLNANVWIGLGQTAQVMMGGELKTGFLGKLIEKTLLKRKISKYQSEKEE